MDDAIARADKAELRPGMTPERRGLAAAWVEPLARVIKAKVENKAHLPHGRLGTLVQILEPRALARIALAAVAPQIGRPGRRKAAYEFERDLKIEIGEIFYANVAAADVDRRSLRRKKRILQGKTKVQRNETPGDRNRRLRRSRDAVWRSLVGDVPRADKARAGAWLLERVVDADLVILIDNDLVPTRRWAKRLLLIQAAIVWDNTRLQPLAEVPAHWAGPDIDRDGVGVRLLSHWNKAHQASIARSLESTHFRNRHLAAVDHLGDVPLCIDAWTLDLVDRYAVTVRRHKDEDRKLAYAQHVDRIVAQGAKLGTFWNTYHLDFRGRLYADQAFNYAQQDSIRALYRFARPAPCGADGFRWLQIHVVNCFGEDKLSFDGRVAWFNEHHDDIIRVATDPRGTFDWWRKADNPFAFAAACREVQKVSDTRLTNLPIASDHTASGLQHLALIRRDSRAAKLVNLVDCSAPSDVYGVLAVRAQELFDANPWASYWREYFKTIKVRKLLKQPGMTFSYASTDRGNCRQIYAAHHEISDDDLPWGAVTYLVSKFREACDEILPGPAWTMKYVQELVRECNGAGRFAEWQTPSGMHVANIYPELYAPTVCLPDGVVNTIADGAVPDTIRAAKAKSAAAANFVHSLDASHLARVVNELAALHFDMLCVHDSFSVLAPHVGQFHITNRSELALMYAALHERGGPLALLREQNGNIGHAPPPCGKFDYWQVQDATYACS
jgi:hypothetical protein